MRLARLTICGSLTAGEITLTAPRDLMPALTVQHTYHTSEPDFALTVPIGDAATQITINGNGSVGTYAIPLPTRAQIRREKWRAVPGFLAAMTRGAGTILHWKLTRDPLSRAKLKSIFGLDSQEVIATDIPDQLFNPQTPETNTSVTLILPVYNAFEDVKECLARVEKNTDLPWHLIVIEDSSTDPQIRPFLRDWAKETGDQVTLLENQENLGFIASVNRGFEVALTRGDPVILVNSDAFVPADWASRLLAPMLADPGVASVTPMSNNAEILSVPKMGAIEQLTTGVADQIDKTAQTLSIQRTAHDLPTGVGFCMAMNIEFLRKVPTFDLAFGPGYGEEVDWCQKIRNLGGRHIGLGALFVEHRGGASFGDATKLALVTKNNAKIAARYPSYDAEVQRFQNDDPMSVSRLVLSIAYCAATQDSPMAIFLAHSMGGGAEMDLQRRIDTICDAGHATIVLRVGGTRRWRIELHRAGQVQQGQSDDFELILQMLSPVDRRHVVYSCGVGDSDMGSLPDHLIRLKRTPDDRIDVLFHDFLPLSPSFTLLNSKGQFRGVPHNEDTDSAHATTRPDNQTMTLADWRAAWGPLIEAANTLEVFSKDSAAHVATAYPTAQNKIRVKPHKPIVHTTPILHPKGRRVIGVLGNIGAQKGAGVLVDLARYAEKHGDFRLVVIGEVDPNFSIPASAKVHGAYDPDDITHLARKYAVSDWLIPSIWPETFSFTTHEALGTGLPVWCFDLGAQAEAVRNASNGQVIPLTVDQDPALAVIAALKETRDAPE